MRYMLKVERSGYSSFPSAVRSGRTTSSRIRGAPRTPVPSAQEGLPLAYGCGDGFENFFMMRGTVVVCDAPSSRSETFVSQMG